MVPVERRKVAARSKRSTAESPLAGEAKEEGVRKSMRRWHRGKRERRGQPDDARRQEKNFWAGLAMQRLIKSSCRARSTPFYLIRYERRASQVQLVHLLEEVSLLTGASSFVMFALFCRRHVRVRSCPANFGEVDVPCLLVRISEC